MNLKSVATLTALGGVLLAAGSAMAQESHSHMCQFGWHHVGFCCYVPSTPNILVDRYGCAAVPDADQDGVADVNDRCADTPALAKVDMHGCPLDSDRDGVPDYKDDCANTPAGTLVDGFGCPLDLDADGKIMGSDSCLTLARGDKVDMSGCSVTAKTLVTFAHGSTAIGSAQAKALKELAVFIKANGGVRFQIQGHADESGSAAANVNLSNRRAQEVRAFLLGQGVKSAQLNAVGYGATRPTAYNLHQDKLRQPLNRRVEIHALPGNFTIRESDSIR